ncbi:MAG TPA: methyltransferase domain-containing protein [Acidimicrobiales bacterium]|nr:methyltransferase domain-containing protein [Acidimicrobiales bacterium]
MAVYDRIGTTYTAHRRPDPRIAALIRARLGAIGPVLDVGAGAGAYEPDDLAVVAVEPSVTMIAHRPAGAGPVVRGVAEALPLASQSCAAGMAVFTVHHWTDPLAGLAEVRRVVRGPIVVLTWEAEAADRFWLVDDYVPMAKTLDQHTPSPERVAEALGGGSIETVPVPSDCIDGFFVAYWARPEAYLDPSVRACISGLARLPAHGVEPGMARLAGELADGTWHDKYGHLLDHDTYDGGYRLVTSPGSAAP